MCGRKIKIVTNMVAEIVYCFLENLPLGIRAYIIWLGLYGLL